MSYPKRAYSACVYCGVHNYFKLYTAGEVYDIRYCTHCATKLSHDDLTLLKGLGYYEGDPVYSVQETEQKGEKKEEEETYDTTKKNNDYDTADDYVYWTNYSGD